MSCCAAARRHTVQKCVLHPPGALEHALSVRRHTVQHRVLHPLAARTHARTHATIVECTGSAFLAQKDTGVAAGTEEGGGATKHVGVDAGAPSRPDGAREGERSTSRTRGPGFRRELRKTGVRDEASPDVNA